MNGIRRYQILADGPQFGAVAPEVPAPADAKRHPSEGAYVWLSVGGALLPPVAFATDEVLLLNV